MVSVRLGPLFSAIQCDAFPKFCPDWTFVSFDDTENMPVPDHQYMLATPRFEVGEEWRRRSIQKLDVLAV